MKDRVKIKMAKVIWLTGISGSGKTTLGGLLKIVLEKNRGQVEFLDGDMVRKFFRDDLGYSREERIMNVKRIAFAAMLVAKQGTPVIVANIAPYYEARDFIRESIPDYIQIYLKTSVEKVMERDVKGHYARYKDGIEKNLVGVDDEYDVPRNPHLIVDTQYDSVEESLQKILNYLKTQGV